MALIRSLIFFVGLTPVCLGQPFNYKISTIAGTNPVNDDGPATSAYLLYPRGVAVDPDGNLFIADYGNHRIRKVATDGVITTVAGTGVWGFSGDGGRAVATRLSYPAYVCYDRGSLLFVESNRVRRVSADGVITTVVSSPSVIYGLAVDAQGVIYFAEGPTNRVRKVNRNGTVSLVAGTGQAGFSGDLGPAVEARLNFPQALTLDNAGNLYIGDGLRVRKVDTSGVITSLYGRDSSQINDPLIGSIYTLMWNLDGLHVGFYSHVARVSGNTVQRLSNGAIGFSGDGPVLSASFDYIQGIAAGSDGALYLADFWNSRVRRIRASAVQTVAGRDRFGGDGGPATQAILFQPYRVALDPSGAIVVSDTRNERIRKVGTDGVISTMIGTGLRGFTGDGTSNTATARVSFPVGVAYDRGGSLLFVDSLNSRIRSISGTGAISTVAGNGFVGYGGDGGPALAALFNSPRGIATDRGGNTYIVDGGNHRVRRITPGGVISTIAGTGTAGSSGDGGPGNLARLSSPEDVAISAEGEIYIVDTGNMKIRKVNANGVISTYAGDGFYRRTTRNGIAATSASLMWPTSIAFDAAGNLFITESDANTLSCVTKQGFYYRVAGNGDTGYNGDGVAALEAALNNPKGLAIDSKGTITIADTDNNRIRQLTPLTAARVAAVSGDQQTGRPGARLANPLVVRVASAEDISLVDVPVTFAVASGQATLSATTVRTDDKGQASVNVTLGSADGVVTIRATAQGAPPLTLTATSDAGVVIPLIRVTEIRSGGPSGRVLTAIASNLWIDVYSNDIPGATNALMPKDGPLPTVLGGFCVEVGGVQAGIRSVDPQRIRIVAPPVDGTETRLRVIAGCGTAAAHAGDAVTLSVQASMPELMAAGEAGAAEYAVALSADSDPRAGATITLQAIGLGVETAATVRVGDVVLDAQVTASTVAGVYNVALTLPEDFAAGQYAVILSAAGVDSPGGATLTVK